ncbi:MAG: TonB-dependent receptor [Maricaulis sp.]|jgi:iron complex outermembrane receptor protein|nr:TonB-dependent receptor [Maricaulis sp.]HAQ36761.1 TonB-dependent receptor [Alphaproteobacteria bacterium]
MRFSLLSSVALACLSSGAAFAQDAEERRTPDSEVERIVVTSSILGATTQEIAGAAGIVDARHIEEDLAGSLADTISHEPGVSSTYFGPAASRPVIRGLGSDRVRVLVNGVGLIDASTASPDHAVATEALEAERIEILRGPAAIAYGGGAIGGVVNVIDGRVPERAPDGPVEGRVYTGATSVDSGHQLAGRIRTSVGPFVFHLEGLTRSADDYDIPGFAESARLRALEHADDSAPAMARDEDDDHESFGVVENTHLDFETGSLGGSWVGDWGFVGLAYKSAEASYGLPGHAHEEEEAPFPFASDEEDEVPPSIEMTQNRWDFRGDIDLPQGSPFTRVRFALGVAQYKHAEIEDGAVGTLFTNDGWEGRVEIRHRPIGNVIGAFGLQSQYRDFSALGDEAFIVPVETTDRGVFLVERYDAGTWGVEGGLRADHREIESIAGNRDFTTWSASGSVFVSPGDGRFVSLTGAITERAPTDIELFADGPHLATQSYERGNPALQPERAYSIDLTGRLERDLWGAEASIFRADYDGFIGLFATGGVEEGLPVFAYRQADASLWGFDGRVTRQIGYRWGWDFSAEGTFEFVRGEVDSGGNLPRIPPLSLSGVLEAERDWVAASVEVTWAAEQDEVTANELPTDSYTLVDAQLVFTPVPVDGLRVIVQGRNLTDEDARLHTSFLKDQVPLPGRNFRVALSYSF